MASNAPILNFMKLRTIPSLGSILLASLALLTSQTEAAIVITGPTPVTELFTVAPPSTSWSTLNMPGGGGDILDPTSLDLQVAGLTASSITNPLGTVTTQGQVAEWKYNSTDADIQSRPTGDAFHVLLATLQNGTGSALNRFSITYGYATANLPGTPEEIPGLRVYYSLTGNVDSWRPIDALSVDTVMTFPAFEDISATVIPPTPIPNNSQFYVLWVDDNGNGFVDASYHIDNVRIVPEPTTSLLWLAGAALVGVPRRSRSS